MGKVERALELIHSLNMSEDELAALTSHLDSLLSVSSDADTNRANDDMELLMAGAEKALQVARRQRDNYRAKCDRLTETIEELLAKLHEYAPMEVILFGYDEGAILRQSIQQLHDAATRRAGKPEADPFETASLIGASIAIAGKDAVIIGKISPDFAPGNPDTIFNEIGDLIRAVIRRAPMMDNLKARTIPGIDNETMLGFIAALTPFRADPDIYSAEFDRAFEELWSIADQHEISRNDARDRFRKNAQDTYENMHKEGRGLELPIHKNELNQRYKGKF